ncbi:hypothetical protein ACS0TY_027866 [Phlomoides rotata]
MLLITIYSNQIKYSYCAEMKNQWARLLYAVFFYQFLELLIVMCWHKVLLKCIVAPVIVAKGFVESLNSAMLVGNGEILGLEWCEVKFIVAIEYDKLLIQKVGSVKVVGQAI